MSGSVSIQDMLKLAIAMEDEGVKFYKDLSNQAESSKSNLFYKPYRDRVVWNEDKGFYKEMEDRLAGMGVSNFYSKGMGQKVTKDEYIGFYKSVGDVVTDGVKSVLNAMAEDEARHGKTFRNWLKEADTSEGAFSPEAAGFFEEYSSNLSFDKGTTAPESMIEALDEAIATEQGAVDFYSGMLEYANPEAKAILEKIIDEEKGHKVKLESQVSKYKLFIQDKTVIN